MQRRQQGQQQQAQGQQEQEQGRQQQQQQEEGQQLEEQARGQQPTLEVQQTQRARRQTAGQVPRWLAESHQEAQPERQRPPQPQCQQPSQPQPQQPLQREPAQPNPDMARNVKDLVKNDAFWDSLQLFADVCRPFVSLMRLVDSNVPCMGKVYHRFYMLTRFAEAVAGDADAMEDIQEAYAAEYPDEEEVSLAKEVFVFVFCMHKKKKRGRVLASPAPGWQSFHF